MGVDKLLDVFATLEERAIRTHPRQCTRLRHRRSGCTLCADSCPTHAISWEGSLQVDADLCTACGACAAVCPTGALEAQAPTNEELLARLRELSRDRASATFVCPTYLKSVGGDGSSSIQINCLSRLDESILVGAYSLGITQISLIEGFCERCAAGKGRQIVEKTVQRANSLLQAYGGREPIVFRPSLPPARPASAEAPIRPEAVSRRDFFGLLTRRAKETTAATLEGVLGTQKKEAEAGALKVGQLPVSVTPKRRLLLAALGRLGAPSALPLEAAGHLSARFGVNEKCTGCQMCAHFCPTGALSKTEEGADFGVLFNASYCTNCGLCRDLCYRNAVTLEPVSDLTRVAEGAAELLPMQRTDPSGAGFLKKS